MKTINSPHGLRELRVGEHFRCGASHTTFIVLRREARRTITYAAVRRLDRTIKHVLPR